MRTDDEWYSSIGYDDNHHAFGGGREFVLRCIRAIQRDAIEAAANAAHWLDKTGGEYARGYNACAFDAGDRIRALLPPAAEITAEKPEA